MCDKLDFKAVLEGHQRGRSNGCLNTWLRCYEQEIITALRLADKLQDMEEDIENYDPTPYHVCDNIIEMIKKEK